MSTELESAVKLDLPQGVSASFRDRTLTVKGKLGSARKEFGRIHVDIEVPGSSVVIKPFTTKKKDVVPANTVHSIIRNMVTGVTQGYIYKLKIVYAHFPVTVAAKGSNIVIENFMGERSPRISKIVGDCKVKVEGDDIIVSGVSLEDVGQTAANAELATKVKRKDQRIFLDGVYVYEKKRN